MPKFRKKPVVIEAVQWTGANIDEVRAFAGDSFRSVRRPDQAEAKTEVYDKLHDTWIRLYDGQWIIRGPKGEFYPHDEELFAKNYEPAGLRADRFRSGVTYTSLAGIVEILARSPEPALGRCLLCNAVVHELTDLVTRLFDASKEPVPVTRHADTCPWKLAQDYVKRQGSG